MVLLPESDFLVRRVQVEGENLGHEFTRIRGRARVSKCFKSPRHRVNDTAFGKVFLPNCPFGYILVKLYLPQNSWGSSTSLARRFFFRQIGWKIWRLGVWADAKQLPFIATCDSVTPWLVAFFSQGWRSSMAWTAQVPLFLVLFLLFPFIPVDGRNPKQPPGMGLKA